MTVKLYDQDSELRIFPAVVRRCRPEDKLWAVVLDQTAFFPEGGGQSGDTGLLGGVRVLDTQEREGEIIHLLEAPLPEGESVQGELNWAQRFRRMQNHSGEHIISGLVFGRYGLHNVGFHLGDGDVTLDFDGELSRQQLEEIELEANQAVADNVKIRTWYPSPTALKRLQYRSKLALTENVRIVRIPGYDICACCAPHVKATGQIGIIKLLDFMRHRGGIRLHILCGFEALADYKARYQNTLEISGLLSAKQLETAQAVRRVCAELEKTKGRLAELKRQLLAMKAAALGATAGNLCFFEPDMDAISLRELVNAGMEKCGGVCAGFSGKEGEWKFIIGSLHIDLRQQGKAIQTALRGRGGGRPEMIQGSAAASRAEIEAFFRETVFSVKGD